MMNGLTLLRTPTDFTISPGAMRYLNVDKDRVNLKQLLLYCLDIPEEINLSIESRKKEYVTGRYCAFLTLMDLGVKEPLIGRNLDRSPIWPIGVLGSLSHTDHRVIACAGLQTDFTGIGIDIEKEVHEDMLPSLQHLVFSKQEVKMLKTVDVSLCRAATLFFSAKESFYKFIYPQTLIHIDFTDFAIVAIERGQFTIKLMKTLSINWRKGDIVKGIYTFDGDYIMTLIALSIVP